MIDETPVCTSRMKCDYGARLKSTQQVYNVAGDKMQSGQSDKLRLVFLCGKDDHGTRSAIEAVCQLPGVEAVAVLLDDERLSTKGRLRNLKRNVRREGWKYVPRRIVSALRGVTDSASWAIPPIRTTSLNSAAMAKRSPFIFCWRSKGWH
jgi:hypothetical protein